VRSLPLAAALLAVLALALGACGGDDEPAAERRPKAPELTVPETEPATATTEYSPPTSSPAPSTRSPAPTRTTSPDQGDSGDSGDEASGDGSSGGTPAPSSPQPDDPTNDTAPPAGIPAERFERFCEANPGACD
jgi:hypothetical protein